MKRQTTDYQFYLSLLEFFMLAKQHIMAIGGEFDLTSIQTMTLLLLDASKPRPMKNFCMLYHCDASNITGIIDGLEKKGLVSRRNDPHDRRIKTIQLEPSGKVMQHDILERLVADNASLLGPLDNSETEQFMRIIEKLAASQTCSQIA